MNEYLGYSKKIKLGKLEKLWLFRPIKTEDIIKGLQKIFKL